MSRLEDLAKQRILILDGAMGTMIGEKVGKVSYFRLSVRNGEEMM